MSCMQSLARRDVSPPNMMMFMAGCERSFFRRLLAALLPTLISAEAKACNEEFVAHASAMCMTIECKMNRVYTRHVKHSPLRCSSHRRATADLQGHQVRHKWCLSCVNSRAYCKHMCLA